MTPMPELFAALMMGLVGSTHCVGMCGGLASGIAGALPSARSSRQQLAVVLLYNIGRLSSYMLAGALIGSAAHWMLQLAALKSGMVVMRVLAGALMIATGLYLGRWWNGLLRLESLGGHLWRRIQPLAKLLLPLRSPWQALALGAVWGWLPCGLVYSALSWSLASGHPVNGALLMLAFGVGTLPAMLGLGIAAQQFRPWLQHQQLRQLGGVALIAFGIQTVWVVI